MQSQTSPKLTSSSDDAIDDPRSVRAKIAAGIDAIGKAKSRLSVAPAPEDLGYCRTSPIAAALESQRGLIDAWRGLGWSHAAIARQLRRAGFPAAEASIKLRLNRLFPNGSHARTTTTKRPQKGS